ncbi:hypothetical protein [Steroidobacter cummioxidans]|uniref:hypothetical protein n=1 Tax=Steroidobacter cummioxidans TaxID=1803913 RepID=UPI000E31BDA9|nr:hypothetical protein [Steroidobacter cummioxidans]
MKDERSGTPDRLRQTLSSLMRQLWRGRWRSRTKDRGPRYDKGSTCPAPLSYATRRSSAKVINLRDRRGALSKGTEPSSRPLTEQLPEEGEHKLIDESTQTLVTHGSVVATAVILVAVVCLWWFDMPSSDTGGTIQTVGEMKRYTLHGGVVASLKEGATLRVDGRDQHGHAHLVEGEATFDVPALDEPFELSTYLATATTSVPSKFTARVNMGVEFEVHTGEVAIRPAGTKNHEHVIKAGKTFRLVDGLAVASERGDELGPAAGSSAQDAL